MYCSGPQPFWHQKLVSCKTNCSTDWEGGVGGGWFCDDSSILHSSSPPAALLGVVWNQADLPVRDPEAWDPNVLLEGRAQHYYPNVYSTGQFGGMSLFLEFRPSHRSHSPERTRGHADSPGRKATLLGRRECSWSSAPLRLEGSAPQSRFSLVSYSGPALTL